jgi:hypothetical protein
MNTAAASALTIFRWSEVKSALIFLNYHH